MIKESLLVTESNKSWTIGPLHFRKGILLSHDLMWMNFPSKNFNLFRRISFSAGEKKTDTFILKLMIKNLFYCFCAKTWYSFILNYRSVGDGVPGKKGVWEKWIRRKKLEFLNMWVKLFWRHSLIIDKCNWKYFFQK